MQEHSDFCQLDPRHSGICSRAVGDRPRRFSMLPTLMALALAAGAIIALVT